MYFNDWTFRCLKKKKKIFSQKRRILSQHETRLMKPFRNFENIQGSVK